MYIDYIFDLLYFLLKSFLLTDSNQRIGHQFVSANLFKQQQTGMISAKVVCFTHRFILYDMPSKKSAIPADNAAISNKLELTLASFDHNVATTINNSVVTEIPRIFGVNQLHSC